MSIDYIRDRASVQEILDHLSRCSEDFIPPLRERVKLPDYALKIVNDATGEKLAYSPLASLDAITNDGQLVGYIDKNKYKELVTAGDACPTAETFCVTKPDAS